LKDVGSLDKELENVRVKLM